MDNIISTGESLISSLNRCLYPYSHIPHIKESAFYDLEGLNDDLGRMISTASYEFNQNLEKISVLGYCDFCDCTKRMRGNCIKVSNVIKILEDPRVKIFSMSELYQISFRASEKEMACISCLKTAIFSLKPFKTLMTMLENKLPKIISGEDISKEIFYESETSFYFESFCDNV